MEVKCINTKNDKYKILEEGKIYDVVEEWFDCYILDMSHIEEGKCGVYEKEMFEKVDYFEDKESNMVHHPDHYNIGIEVIKYINSWEMDFLEGNIIKYVTRYKNKNGVEDLKKAKQYLEWLIEREEKENDK